MKKWLLYIPLLLLSACSAMTIPDQENKPEWSGSVPPLYWRWNDTSGGRQNVIFPLAYFTDSAAPLYTPLFGWDSPKNFIYYLTPLFRFQQGAGIQRHDFAVMNIRLIDQDSHPEAKTSFDGELYAVLPSLSILTLHTPLTQGKRTSANHAFLPALGLYQNAIDDGRDPRMPVHMEKQSYGGYTRAYSKIEQPYYGLSRTQLTRDVIPFWYSSAQSINAASDNDLKTHVSTDNYIFPVIYWGFDKGDFPLPPQKNMPLTFEKKDESIFLVFPLFGITKKYKNTMNFGPCFLWVNSYIKVKDRDLYSWLWLFEYIDEPKTSEFAFAWRLFRLKTGEKPALHLFFIPVYGSETDTQTKGE